MTTSLLDPPCCAAHIKLSKAVQDSSHIDMTEAAPVIYAALLSHPRLVSQSEVRYGVRQSFSAMLLDQYLSIKYPPLEK